MSNKVYDVMKWVVMVFLPAAGVFYSALSKIWGWPYGTEIAGTLAAITAFLGTILQISSGKYKVLKIERAAQKSTNDESKNHIN